MRELHKSMAGEEKRKSTCAMIYKLAGHTKKNTVVAHTWTMFSANVGNASYLPIKFR